ncbi:MAG: hypothetical protein IJS39_06535 [Synergistaceae bacterium]|nr:hypothetical protein [Synergistaceae bacterium]
MKKLLLKGSVFVMYLVVLELVFPAVVDPFNVFHAEDVKPGGVYPNHNYIKMKYILKRPDRFNGCQFIFGSSRVGNINPDKISAGNIYNMTYSEGLPAEHLANIKTFLANSIIPSKIYLGVDSLSYTASMDVHIYEPMRCPYEYLCNDPLLFYSLYMNPASTIHALGVMFSKKSSGKKQNSLYRVGTTINYGIKVSRNWESLAPSIGHVPLSDIPQSIRNTLKDIHELSELCRISGIELVIFTNPMHHITYRASLELGYFEFLEGLAEISDFWNFSSLSDITMSNDLYLETSHFKAEVGDMIIEFMCKGRTDPELQAQGFGLKVTRENIKEFLGTLKKQADTFTANS